jgi:hypothetical protein
MTPYLIYVKVGAVLVAVALVFGVGWHFGGASTRDAADKAHAAQLTNVVAVLEKRQAAAETELIRRQGIIDAYDRNKNTPSPIVAGLGQRVLIYSRGPGCSAVPSLPAVAGGASDTAAKSPSDERTERVSELNQFVYDACNADAKQMKAMIQLATPP